MNRNINAEKIMKKSALSKCFNTIFDKEIKAEILKLLSKMIEETRLDDNLVYKHCAYSILPATAIYKVLSQYEGKDIAYINVEDCVLGNAKKQERFFKSLSVLPCFFKLFGKMCKIGVKTNFGAPAFDMIWEENSKTVIKWTCKSCVYDNKFTQYGVEELTKIFCKADDVMYGNLKDAIWARTKTIGNGDEICDFKFISKVEL